MRRKKPRESAQHINVAVREVDEAQHAINHGVAKRDQGVNRALRQAVDELLKNFHEAMTAGQIERQSP